MINNGYPPHLVNAIKSLYHATRIVINTGNKRTDEIKINQGVRQGCSLSPTLFNIYIDDVLKKWQSKEYPGVQLDRHTYLSTLLFADDKIIIQESEDKLQLAVHRLNQICPEYNLKISLHKTKVMAFQGKYPVRSKIIVNNKPIEQVSNFTYLGCDTSYNYDNDMENKINKFQAICGTINRTLNNKTRKDTRIKFYKTMAVPVLMYGSESWINTKKGDSKIQAAEMRFLRRVKGCTRRDLVRNEDVRNELNVYAINEKITEYKERWKQHVNRMGNGRIPKKILNYNPRGKRDIGRPRKRWS